MNQKYKPVTFVNGKVGKTRNNSTQQVMLLQALAITQDPNKLRQMVGFKTVADVFRTLDKMALRKDYHAALARNETRRRSGGMDVGAAAPALVDRSHDRHATATEWHVT